MAYQLLRYARVFARNTATPRKYINCPQGDVAEIANRRGDYIEAGIKGSAVIGHALTLGRG